MQSSKNIVRSSQRRHHQLHVFLLGAFLANTYTCTLSGAAKTEDFAPGPDKPRPEWARLTHGIPKDNRNSEAAREESPQEWEFLGCTAPELHSRYDSLSSCQPEPARFWFHGCGGIEGGGFIEVKYGDNGKVVEAWQCASGCTYTSCGPHFTDKQEALKYAVTRATKDLKSTSERESISIAGARRILKARVKANHELGNKDLVDRDLKVIDQLAPLLAREVATGKIISGSGWAPLARVQEEFKRNGYDMKALSPRKYEFVKSGSKGFTVTANDRNLVRAEEAVWFLDEEIGKEAKRLISAIE